MTNFALCSACMQHSVGLVDRVFIANKTFKFFGGNRSENFAAELAGVVSSEG